MPAVLLVASVLAAAPVDAPVDVDPPRPAPPRADVVRFLDGGAPRAAIRLDEPRDASWPAGATGVVLYVDPPTGRSQRAWIDETAILRFAPGVDVLQEAARLGVRVVRPLHPRIGAWLVKDVLGSDGLDVAARLVDAVRAGDVVVDAFPNLWLVRELRAVDVPPDDPRYPGQNYLETIDVEAAWAISTGAPDVTISIVDNGCDLLHEDLSDKLVGGVDVLDQDDDPSYVPDVAGAEHGTACAGLAAASTDNGRGIAGACPECTFACYRFILPEPGPVPVTADLDVVREQMELGVAVSSNSWGFAEPTPVPAAMRAAYEDMVDEGRDGKGVVVVFAAGNHNRIIEDDELENVRGVLTVGAVTVLEEVAQFSNGGNAVDLTCPLGTLTTDLSGAHGVDPTDYFATFGGTSSSTPVVAGLAGLMIAAKPDATSQEIVDALTSTAQQSIFATPDEDGHDDYYGYGVVRPAQALDALLGLSEVEPVVLPPPTGPCAHVDAKERGGPWGLAALLVLPALLSGFRRRGRRSSAA